MSVQAMTVATGKGLSSVERGSDDEQFLTFHCGGGFFGASILTIKEIIQYGQVTDIPLMPGEIRGVINLRGAVVPVVDLAVRFGRDAAVIGRRTCIVIIEVQRDGERQDIGVLVDAVSEVLEIPARDIEPAPSFGASVRAEFMRGMGKVGGGFVILIDVQRTFAMTDLSVLVAQAAQNAEASGISAAIEAQQAKMD